MSKFLGNITANPIIGTGQVRTNDVRAVTGNLALTAATANGNITNTVSGTGQITSSTANTSISQAGNNIISTANSGNFSTSSLNVNLNASNNINITTPNASIVQGSNSIALTGQSSITINGGNSITSSTPNATITHGSNFVTLTTAAATSVNSSAINLTATSGTNVTSTVSGSGQVRHISAGGTMTHGSATSGAGIVTLDGGSNYSQGANPINLIRYRMNGIVPNQYIFSGNSGLSTNMQLLMGIKTHTAVDTLETSPYSKIQSFYQTVGAMPLVFQSDGSDVIVGSTLTTGTGRLKVWGDGAIMSNGSLKLYNSGNTELFNINYNGSTTQTWTLPTTAAATGQSLSIDGNNLFWEYPNPNIYAATLSSAASQATANFRVLIGTANGIARNHVATTNTVQFLTANKTYQVTYSVNVSTTGAGNSTLTCNIFNDTTTAVIAGSGSSINTASDIIVTLTGSFFVTAGAGGITLSTPRISSSNNNYTLNDGLGTSTCGYYSIVQIQ